MSDGTDIAHIEERGTSVATVNDSKGMLAMIASAASNPAVDANKMVTLAKLATELQDRERQAEFSRDKVAAISKLPAVYKDKENGGTRSRYATWEAIHARVMPILAAHNLTVTHETGQAGNMITVEAILEHSNGITLRGGPLPLPIDNSGSKNPVQGVASTVAYGKRITGKAILNIIESNNVEDRDGQSEPAAMDPRQRQLLDDAERAAKAGPTTYLEFFKQLDAAARGWLTFGNHHDRLKALAASL
jgi:hypothetical protein